MNHSTLTNQAWTNIGTGLSVAVLQGAGDIAVFVGSSAPDLNDQFFLIDSGVPVEVPQVAALGGGVWVRSIQSVGGVAYATA